MNSTDPTPVPTSDEPGWRRPKSSRFGKIILLALLVCSVAAFFIPWSKIKRALLEMRQARVITKDRIVEKERVVEKRVEVNTAGEPPPLPTTFVPAKEADMAKLWNGMKVVSNLESTEGENATTEREDADSFTINYQVNIRIPRAINTLEELGARNPNLPQLLPGLGAMVEKGKVSGFYHHLYETKRKDLQRDLTRLDRILTKHNFFDLETILELENADTKQKLLLIQAEMDVVSDGSDGDRMPTFDDYIAKSQHFQPTTSYSWPKVTNKPNPLLSRLEEELRVAKEKVAKGTKEEKAQYASDVSSLPRYIGDLKRRSYLIAQEDPFIVIPLSFKSYTKSNAHAPSIGDYAVVIWGEKMMPAIIGDYGPAEKIGEASLRIAKEINPKAGPYNRPVSDLSVTYLIFPASADESAQPNLANWHKRCTELMDKIGGLGTGIKLHEWADKFNPPTPPAPAPPPVPETTTATPP